MVHIRWLRNKVKSTFFHRIDREIPDWDDLADLAGLLIGVVPGYTLTPRLWEERFAENPLRSDVMQCIHG